MKTISLYLVLLSLLALTEQACGQDDQRKLRNDPTYSTHNYKHANKAATARKWEGNSGVVVKQPADQLGQSSVANYKRQVPNQTPVGGVTVGHTPSTDVADRNYKIQRPSQSSGSATSGVATKRKDRADKGTAIGD